jgi:hypothetical protein
MLTHFTSRLERLILAAASLALVLLVVAGATRLYAQEADEVEISFAAPAIAAAHTSVAIFVDGVVCADLMSDSLHMPVILGPGCVEDGDTIEFLVYGDVESEDGAQAVRLTTTFVAEGGAQLVLDDWTTDAPDAPLPEYMSAYIAALDGSPPADTTVEPETTAESESTAEDAAVDDGKQELPALPEVGNLGFTPPGPSAQLLIAAVAAMVALVVGARRGTRPARTR